MEISQLRRIPVFKGFEDTQIHSALKGLGCRSRKYRKDELILLEGSKTSELGIVLKGSVCIERLDYMGNRNILSHVDAGGIFAETYAMMKEIPLMVDVAAVSDCQILFVDLAGLERDSIKEMSWYPLFLMNLLRLSSRKNLELSGRSFHTSSKHVRGRVLSYLNAQANARGTRTFDIPFNRQQMADYLNLDRSALSKELGRMKRDGLIDYWKNHFVLK